MLVAMFILPTAHLAAALSVEVATDVRYRGKGECYGAVLASSDRSAIIHKLQHKFIIYHSDKPA